MPVSRKNTQNSKDFLLFFYIFWDNRHGGKVLGAFIKEAPRSSFAMPFAFFALQLSGRVVSRCLGSFLGSRRPKTALWKASVSRKNTGNSQDRHKKNSRETAVFEKAVSSRRNARF